MTGYKLMYWNKRGRGEQVRLLLNELGLEYEDVHVAPNSARFQEIQAQGPKMLYFGAVPMLQDDAFNLCQGPVILSYLATKHGIAPADLRQAAKADAICWGAEDLRTAYFQLFGPDAAEKQEQFVTGPWRQRWLRSFDGLLELNGDTGFFVGDSLTHADIAVWDILDTIKTWVAGATLDGFPRLQGFVEAIAKRPRIATYLNSDRRPQA